MVSTSRSVFNSRVSEVSEIILTFLCFNAVRSAMDGSLNVVFCSKRRSIVIELPVKGNCIPTLKLESSKVTSFQGHVKSLSRLAS